MNEYQLQLIWQQQQFFSEHLKSTCGKSIVVLDPGILNKDQGPDFNFAKLKIDQQEWIGSVELHVRTSDWYVHKHQHDENYKKVILHVVWKHDVSAFDQSPVLEIKPLCKKSIFSAEVPVCTMNNSIRCGADPIVPISTDMYDWVGVLGLSRAEKKSDEIIHLLNMYRGDWDTITWLLMARGFGQHVNADSFFAIAKSIPFFLIRLSKYDPVKLEALVFGQSGLLQHDWHDEYPRQLKDLYNILKHKYGLTHQRHPLLFLRMRPGNFPTIRLSQLASLYHLRQHVFRSIIDADDVGTIKELLVTSASSYWENKISFDKSGVKHPRLTGNAMINTLIINVIVPILFAYSKVNGNSTHKIKALEWLREMGSESNSILDQFKRAGFRMDSAFDSQSLLELYRHFCSRNLCHACLHGKALISPS